jgi:hypothetical protein
MMIFALVFSTFAHAQCEVDGISDSPQGMKCFIYNQARINKLELECVQSQYHLILKGNRHQVEAAYHEEVETGSSPLVFVSGEVSLTTVSYGVYSLAELKIQEKISKGLCFPAD